MTSVAATAQLVSSLDCIFYPLLNCPPIFAGGVFSHLQYKPGNFSTYRSNFQKGGKSNSEPTHQCSGASLALQHLFIWPYVQMGSLAECEPRLDRLGR